MVVNIIIIAAIGLVLTAAFAGLLYFAIAQTKSSIKGNLKNLEDELNQKKATKDQIEGMYQAMVDLGTMRQLIQEHRTFEESLKAERGRITITQAELETVETRLRELEEIERELEASGIETKEEMKILEKKEAELKQKNETLKSKIQNSLSQIDEVMGTIESNSVVQEQVAAMQTELLQTQEKIDVLLVQIEQGNEQYFILKKRYDALDIEYAQLYEKFAEVEGDE